ncbi:sulfite exporter TauE/SafE family protein [Actinomycetospora sp. TBRC 11914]|uniref:sulfite exporter TauE/SafE family protein n=1 Tax=Actinomycetospora sp. TBRC 11914 TaxID=2729387 RepID=UPI00145D3986|nr:sulfite exporter TauE/SafE family protein [Actinomycetospora sp. TBRC 11914]NMO89390.1 sulfite exporter TauE/SafE family protein [Actinomycetospora sp. TBRC 11914]
MTVVLPAPVLLVLAGVGAGLSGSMAGLASLFSYPALLAVGLPPTVANQTNTIALATSSIGSIVSSRPELRGQRARVLRLLPLTVLGGVIGGALVLVTPSETFALIVPFLVGGASLVLLRPPRPAEPGTARAARSPGRPGPATVLGAIAIGVYSGYFGAAAGVLMLALLSRLLADTLVRVNAVKNVLLGASNAVAAIGFIVLGHVAWSAALPLTAGLLVGNYTGPAIARRLPPTVLRVGIAVAGLVLAVVLFVDAVRG